MARTRLEAARNKKIRTLADCAKVIADRIAPAAGLSVADLVQIAPACVGAAAGADRDTTAAQRSDWLPNQGPPQAWRLP
ncbi:hypothetical protein GCM10010393_16060 [Streptomyces gobitricini]|uniref:Uncharacterized protein n=1 Tax=Streptomyces gobitricini TaxID=68211 RepID=A0ABP5YRQ6_9ACTN